MKKNANSALPAVVLPYYADTEHCPLCDCRVSLSAWSTEFGCCANCAEDFQSEPRQLKVMVLSEEEQAAAVAELVAQVSASCSASGTPLPTFIKNHRHRQIISF